MTAPAPRPLQLPDATTPIGFVIRRASVQKLWSSVGAATDDPAVLVERLMAREKQVDAVRCIAVAIPARQAIWWAWVSARHIVNAEPAAEPSEQEARLHLLGVVEQWITAPHDATRRDAWEAAQALGLDHPIALAAAAVWFSGGSIAPAGAATAVQAPPGMPANFVAAAVAGASLPGDAALLPERWRGSVAQGLEIITRLGGWAVSVKYARQEFEGQTATPGAA
jgi:hypothetical protein